MVFVELKEISSASSYILYGAETAPTLLRSMTLAKKIEEKLIIFKNKILRKVFGPEEEVGEYRRRNNSKNLELYKEADVDGGGEEQKNTVDVVCAESWKENDK